MIIIERMRAYETDHQTDGYPAVTMQQISELCDVAERYRKALEQIARLSPAMVAPFVYAQSLASKALKIETGERHDS